MEATCKFITAIRALLMFLCFMFLTLFMFFSSSCKFHTQKINSLCRSLYAQRSKHCHHASHTAGTFIWLNSIAPGERASHIHSPAISCDINYTLLYLSQQCSYSYFVLAFFCFSSSGIFWFAHHIVCFYN